MKIKQKAYAVLFLHTEGWTVSSVVFSKESAEYELEKQMEILPDFKYRICPCTIEVSTLKN